MPVDDPLRGRVYATMRVDIDEPTLREVASLTGGEYFRATDTESLGEIWAQIDELERTEIEVENFTQYAERFPLALGAATAISAHTMLDLSSLDGESATLLQDAGVAFQKDDRGYRPRVALPDTETKLLKPQNVVEMLHAGTRDVGFAGADWVAELQADLVEVVDTGMDPVRVVAAAPRELLVEGRLPRRPLVVASEYEALTRAWVQAQGIDATFVRSYGATEVFPPEDADLIVDNTATGSTMKNPQRQP